MSRVLIVEDDGALRQDMYEQVAGWGYDVRAECDGQGGLSAIHNWQPDLVLSDVNMPNGSGYELIRSIKALGLEYSDLAFIFISARSLPKMIVEGISIGADDYLTKPIDYALLKVKLEAHLRKREQLLGLDSPESLAETMTSATYFAATLDGARISSASAR